MSTRKKRPNKAKRLVAQPSQSTNWEASVLLTA